MLPILLAFVAAAIPAGNPLAIRAKTAWLPGGRVLENAVVIVNDGRIVSVGANADIPEGAEVLEHDGVLTAGMIALHGATGASGETSDSTRTAMPEARIGLAVDGRASNFEALRRAGITSIVVTPDASGVTSGTSAVVRTLDGVVLRDPAHLSLVFSTAALTPNREPTSRSGAIAMLNRLFEDAHGVVADARAGKLPCLFEVREREDVIRAIAFAREHKLRGALNGAWLSGEMADAILQSKLSVIVPPLQVGTSKRVLDAMARLSQDGISFGFGLDAPDNHADAMRLTAALCVRAGMNRQLAWQGLTENAAKIAGVEARTGRIERGLDADLCLWSGDPLDLGSRAVTLVVGGVLVDVKGAADTAKESH